jgi:hypothetical protein
LGPEIASSAALRVFSGHSVPAIIAAAINPQHNAVPAIHGERMSNSPREYGTEKCCKSGYR